MILFCCPLIIPYLTNIVNCCIEKKYFPTSWKIANIMPLPKTKKPVEYKDLRPISILPILSKLIEKVLNMQIREHLDKFKILPPTQSGFRASHSCSTALLKVTDDILSATDKNKLTALILLDYSKAFDRINHQLLLAILHYYGFGEDSLAMIQSYLENRLQRVRIKGKLSTPLNISSGVPQGSILGPTLFTIFTSNLYSYISFCEFHCYADDSQLYLSFDSKNLQEAAQKINADLDSIIVASKNHLLDYKP